MILSAFIPSIIPPRQFPLITKDTALFAVTEPNFEPDYPDEAPVRKNAFHPKARLFEFDPNSISVEEWMELGLNEKTAKTIEKFRIKGGRFYKAEDISKIYGLSGDDYTRLLPYVRIENDKKNAPLRETKIFSDRTHEAIDINIADSAAFEKLPGIGSKLASRIVNFRSRIGGFYSKHQLREVYGIHDSVFAKFEGRIILNNADVKKININLATAEEIKSHPYFKWPLANAIVNYRKQHGDFKTIDGLKNIASVSDSIFLKIRNYITVN